MISDKAKNKLLKAHGLDPEKHNDSDVDDAIENSIDQGDYDAEKNRADAAEAALAENEVAGDLTKYKNRIGKKTEFWKNALIENRAAALEALDELPEPTAVVDPKANKQPVHNRGAAGSPAPVDAPDKTEAEKTKFNSLIQNRAKKLQDEGHMQPMLAHVEANRQINAEIAAGMHK